MEVRARELIRSLNLVVLSCAVFGASAGIAITLPQGGTVLMGAFRGVVTGLLCGFIIGGFEVLIDRGTLMWRVRRLPVFASLAARLLIYVSGLVCCVLVGRLITHATFGLPMDYPKIDADFWAATSVSLGLAVLIFLSYKVMPLVGMRTMWHLLLGFYLRPRKENRVILFMDLIGSTALTERIGDTSFLRFFNEVIFEMTSPILRNKGEIYRYVGDEVIITWPEADSRRAVRCVFEIIEALEARREHFQNRYGTFPVFRHGLHVGPVVVGELGDLHLEIALLGDAINTTARIEDMCRQCEHFVMVSYTLIERAELPKGVDAHLYGSICLKGKSETLRLYALERDLRTRPVMRQSIRERLSLS